jgi:hypothetical protein
LPKLVSKDYERLEMVCVWRARDLFQWWKNPSFFKTEVYTSIETDLIFAPKIYL